MKTDTVEKMDDTQGKITVKKNGYSTAFRKISVKEKEIYGIIIRMYSEPDGKHNVPHIHIGNYY